MSEAVVTVKPAALELKDAAVYVSLSVGLVKELSKDPKSGFPLPVQLAKRRVAYRTDELDAWVRSRPRSSNLPPEGSGHGRKGKAGAEQVERTKA
jgi:prophage regulatory protein